MNKNFRHFICLITMVLFVSSCSSGEIGPRAETPSAPTTVTYETLLGKSLRDRVVTDFLAGHSCSSADQYLLCKTAGMALWMDSDQVVEIVYLYLNNADGFAPYKGELPFGLKFYDTMGSVEYKLKQQGLGNGGRPDFSETPDHIHYRATYEQAGLSILYNAPVADEDASIYAILLRRPGSTQMGKMAIS